MTARDEATYWSKIAIFYTPPAFDAPVGIAMAFGMEKLEWCGYPTVNLKIYLFVSAEYRNVTDRRTDGQADRRTSHDGISNARQKVDKETKFSE